MFDSLTASDSLQFRFATDGAGNYGYLKADDSFVPFKQGGDIELVTDTGVIISNNTIVTKTFTNLEKGNYLLCHVGCNNSILSINTYLNDSSIPYITRGLDQGTTEFAFYVIEISNTTDIIKHTYKNGGGVERDRLFLFKC